MDFLGGRQLVQQAKAFLIFFKRIMIYPLFEVFFKSFLSGKSLASLITEWSEYLHLFAPSEAAASLVGVCSIVRTEETSYILLTEERE